jgi:cell division septal protein FtsQ
MAMSWFQRKPRNRRLRREHLLDVKLRSSQVRAARLRMAAVALGVVFAAVLSIYLFWRAGQLALNRLLYTNRSFAIQTIEVETDGIIAPEQIRRWARVKAGDNLLALDLARVKRDLELVSLVRSVSIERILPHTLRIRVAEREPIAQVNLPRPRPGGPVEFAPCFLDEEGVVILPLDPSQRAAPPDEREGRLPVIQGLNLNEVQPGRRIESPQLQAALQLITAFDASPMAGLSELKRIDVSASDILVAATGEGSEITFGLVHFEQQLRRWRDIAERGRRFGKAIAWMDLAITNNIPVRWLEASAVPSTSPKSPKPTRNRKKNV